MRQECTRQPWRLLLCLLVGLFAGGVTADYIGLDARILSWIDKKYGAEAKDRVNIWHDMIRYSGKLPEQKKLKKVNDFFNSVRYVKDIEHWGKQDYWATPVELLATLGGDCEDFSIAKYFTLVELGVEADKLRITYVKAITQNQAHMVLAYYPKPSAEPLILDNMIKEIKPASKRKDLIPVYSFNGNGLWRAQQRGQGKRLGNASRLNLWRDLAARMAKEGA